MHSMLDPLCERARAWASLELDDDLGEIERVLLDDHLTRCCAAARPSSPGCASSRRSSARRRRSGRSARSSCPRGAAASRSAVRVLAAATIVALAAGLAVLGSSVGGQTEATAPRRRGRARVPPLGRRRSRDQLPEGEAAQAADAARRAHQGARAAWSRPGGS